MLNRLGLNDERLLEMPKGAAKKAVLAWCLRKYTTVARAWIAERLAMGDELRITKLVREVEQGTAFDSIKQKLEDS